MLLVPLFIFKSTYKLIVHVILVSVISDCEFQEYTWRIWGVTDVNRTCTTFSETCMAYWVFWQLLPDSIYFCQNLAHMVHHLSFQKNLNVFDFRTRFIIFLTVDFFLFQFPAKLDMLLNSPLTGLFVTCYNPLEAFLEASIWIPDGEIPVYV